jgi:hypothetical protein
VDVGVGWDDGEYKIPTDDWGGFESHGDLWYKWIREGDMLGKDW